MKKFTILLIIISIFPGCEQQFDSRLGMEKEKNRPRVVGVFLDLNEPDSVPKIFAPGIANNGLNNRDITMTPEGKEFYTTITTANYSYATILQSNRTATGWSDPEVVSFGKDPNSITIEPCLSSDGNILFFASDKPISDTLESDDMNIWKTERTENGWGKPKPLCSEINTSQGEYYPSVTTSGTLYYTREEENRINFIYRSQLVDGSYSTPEKLPDHVQFGHNRFNAYIAPDERFIIIPALGVEKSVAGVAYYISFRTPEDNWSNPVNMGEIINQDLGRGWSASLSNDGKYLFFMSSRDIDTTDNPQKLSFHFFKDLQTSSQNGNSNIYWVESDFIERLREKAIYPD